MASTRAMCLLSMPMAIMHDSRMSPFVSAGVRSRRAATNPGFVLEKRLLEGLRQHAFLLGVLEMGHGEFRRTAAQVIVEFGDAILASSAHTARGDPYGRRGQHDGQTDEDNCRG